MRALNHICRAHKKTKTQAFGLGFSWWVFHGGYVLCDGGELYHLGAAAEPGGGGMARIEEKCASETMKYRRLKFHIAKFYLIFARQ